MKDSGSVYNRIKEVVYKIIPFIFPKIRLGVIPKRIVISDSDGIYEIPCYDDVAKVLQDTREGVGILLENKLYKRANSLIFGYLKLFDSRLSKYENSEEDFSEVINYIYNNLE